MIDKNILIRRTVCAVTAFVLSLCLMCSALIATVFIASDEKFLSFAENKSNYAEMSIVTLKTELEDLTIPGGFPLDFFNSRIDEELYNRRVSESFAANISGAPLSYNIESVSKEFYDMTAKYVLEEDGEIAEVVDEGLHGLSLECAKVYVKYSNPSSVKLVVKYFPSIRRVLLYAVICVAVLLIASAFLLVRLCLGRDLLKHLIFTFGAASLLSGVLPAILLMSGEIKKISLTLPALHSFAVTFFEGVLRIPCLISLAFLLVTVTISVIKLIKFIKANK